MTRLDKIGRKIAGYLYREYIRNPGPPTAAGYVAGSIHTRFCAAWPWSHGSKTANWRELYYVASRHFALSAIPKIYRRLRNARQLRILKRHYG